MTFESLNADQRAQLANEKRREYQREYQRRFRKEHPDKVKAYREHYWMKLAEADFERRMQQTAERLNEA